jgi:HPt (histidine-containing phosphotransfer) domain-containing protein
MSVKHDARLEALAADFEIEIEFLELAVHEGAVREDELTREAHSAAALARLRRLQRLCASLELDVYAGSIIVDLLERLEAAQQELESRRRGIEG